MIKPLTKRTADNRVRALIGPLREALEAPRPAGLRPAVAWGVAWDVDYEHGVVVGVAVTVHAVDRRHLLRADDERRADGWCPLTPAARALLGQFCEAVRARTGLPCRWNWSLGCRDLSEGNLAGLT